MLNIGQLIEDESGDRKYFAMVPGILWPDIKRVSSGAGAEESHIEELGVELDVYDKWLYTTIKRVCGEKGGQCFLNTSGLARLAGMSEGKVSTGKRKLAQAGLIVVIAKKRSSKGHAIDHITVIDIWERNVTTIKARESLHHMKASSPEGSGQDRSPPEGNRSRGETEEEPIEEKPKGEEEIIGENPDLWELAQKTEEAQRREGNWADPAAAGGASAWTGAPVDAFCQFVAGVNSTLLPDTERLGWGAELREIAIRWSTEARPITPEMMVAAVEAVPTSDIGWKTYTSPFAGNFDRDIGPLLLDGGQKGKQHEKSQRVPDDRPGRTPEQWRDPTPS